MADYPFQWPPPDWLDEAPPLSGETSFAGSGIPMPAPEQIQPPVFEPVTADTPVTMPDFTLAELGEVPAPEPFPPPHWELPPAQPQAAAPVSLTPDAVSRADVVPGMIPDQPPVPVQPPTMEQAIAAESAVKQQAAEIKGRHQAYAADKVAFERMRNERLLATVLERNKQDRAAAELALAEQEKTKLDPDRVVRNKSIWEKIGLVLLSALSGSIRSNMGKPNPVLEMIQGEVDRDIDAQKADIINKRDVVGRKMSLLEQNLRAGIDEYTAKALAIDGIYKTQMEKMQADLSLLDSPFAQAEEMKKMAILTEARRDHQQKLSDEKWKRDFEVQQNQDETLRQRISSGPAYKMADLAQQEFDWKKEHPVQKQISPELAYKMEADKAEKAVYSPVDGGFLGFAQDAADRKELGNAAQEFVNVRAGLKWLTDFNKKHGSMYQGPGEGVISGSILAEAKTTHAGVIRSLGTLFNLGVLQPGDMTIITRFVPGPEGWTSANPQASYRRALEELAHRTRAGFRRRNMDDSQPAFDSLFSSGVEAPTGATPNRPMESQDPDDLPRIPGR